MGQSLSSDAPYSTEGPNTTNLSKAVLADWLVTCAVGGAPSPRKSDIERNEPNLRAFGEDACLVVPAPGGFVFGVADGVGSYENRCDPGDLSRGVMREAAVLTRKEGLIPPVELMTRAYNAACEVVPLGGTTVTLLQMQVSNEADVDRPISAFGKRLSSGSRSYSSRSMKSSSADSASWISSLDEQEEQRERSGQETELILDALTLGDSSFVIIRDGKVVVGSEDPDRGGAYGAPNQLTAPPAKHKHSNPLLYFSDPARDGRALSCSLRSGDIVVLGSDGLWDNLGAVEGVTGDKRWRAVTAACLSIVEQHRARGPDAIVKGLKAAAVSRMQNAMPLLRNAMRSGIPYDVLIGKPDDLSIIVVTVGDAPKKLSDEDLTSKSGPTKSLEVSTSGPLEVRKKKSRRKEASSFGDSGMCACRVVSKD